MAKSETSDATFADSLAGAGAKRELPAVERDSPHRTKRREEKQKAPDNAGAALQATPAPALQLSTSNANAVISLTGTDAGPTGPAPAVSTGSPDQVSVDAVPCVSDCLDISTKGVREATPATEEEQAPVDENVSLDDQISESAARDQGTPTPTNSSPRTPDLSPQLYAVDGRAENLSAVVTQNANTDPQLTAANVPSRIVVAKAVIQKPLERATATRSDEPRLPPKTDEAVDASSIPAVKSRDSKRESSPESRYGSEGVGPLSVTQLSTALPTEHPATAPVDMIVANSTAVQPPATHVPKQEGPAVTTQVTVPMLAANMDASATALQSARLVQAAGQTEMRLAFHSPELGAVSIHTAATSDAIAARIAVDHTELATMLTVQLPEMHARLGVGHTVEVALTPSNGGTAGDGQASSGGRDGGRDTPQKQVFGRSMPDILEAIVVQARPHMGDASGRLDVRA